MPIQVSDSPIPIPVIINPSARSNRSGNLVEKVAALSPLIEIHETRAAGHAGELAEGFARQGVPLIVAAGGDGTINEVANGLAHGGLENGTRLGIIPTGTMNVFSVELGLPPSLFLKKCWEVIAGDHEVEVDLWKANEHYFVQLAGIGLDAQAIKETSWSLKRVIGPFSYLLSLVGVLRDKAPVINVKGIEGREYTGAFVLVGNGQRYGGPFKFFRSATNCDGLLDVIVVQGQGVSEIAELFKAAGINAFDDAEDVQYFQTKELTVTSGTSTEVSLEVDGDHIGSTPVTFRHAEHSLIVKAPKNRFAGL